MIMLFIEINFGSGDAYIKLDVLLLMVCTMYSILKLLFFRLYADNLICNFSSAVNDYVAIDTEEKRTIMRRHAFMGRMICYSILFFAYFAPVLFLVPIAGDDKDIQVNASLKNQASDLPVPLTWALRNYDLSANLFIVISTVQYILLILTSNSNCGN